MEKHPSAIKTQLCFSGDCLTGPSSQPSQCILVSCSDQSDWDDSTRAGLVLLLFQLDPVTRKTDTYRLQIFHFINEFHLI